MNCLTNRDVRVILETLPLYFKTRLDSSVDCHTELAKALGESRVEAKAKLYQFLYSYNGVAQLLWVRKPYVALHIMATELSNLKGTTIKEELDQAEVKAAIKLNMPERFCQ